MNTSSMPNVIDYHYHSIWKDQIDYIKYYNGITYSHTIDHIYDSSGNLESTSDSRQSGNNLELTYEGRTLINYHVPMGAYGRDVDFKYNDSGYRTRKVSTGYMMPTITTDYYLEGSKVIHETDGTNNIYYNYDVDGSLISMFYNGVEYFYVYNVLGDVIKLLDTNGDIVVEYSCDAWGNIKYQTPNETIATANPYRYRGYRYDEETNLYYLNSRYYNPETGRFLNADGILDTGGVLGKNMYAYTYNNPVMFTNKGGYMPVAYRSEDGLPVHYFGVNSGGSRGPSLKYILPLQLRNGMSLVGGYQPSFDNMPGELAVELFNGLSGWVGDFIKEVLVPLANGGKNIGNAFGMGIKSTGNAAYVLNAYGYYSSQTTDEGTLFWAMVFESLVTFGSDAAINTISVWLGASTLGIGSIIIVAFKAIASEALAVGGRHLLKTLVE